MTEVDVTMRLRGGRRHEPLDVASLHGKLGGNAPDRAVAADDLLQHHRHIQPPQFVVRLRPAAAS